MKRVPGVGYLYNICVLAHLIHVYALALEHTVIFWITLHRPRATIISMLTLSMVSQLRFIGKRHSEMFRQLVAESMRNLENNAGEVFMY